MEALEACDTLVYVLPCGRSASWEFGYAMGQGKPCHVLWLGDHEPELMFLGAAIHGSLNELITEMGA
jgi:nucleoside 2-deoxyribosyltransferase